MPSGLFVKTLFLNSPAVNAGFDLVAVLFDIARNPIIFSVPAVARNLFDVFLTVPFVRLTGRALLFFGTGLGLLSLAHADLILLSLRRNLVSPDAAAAVVKRALVSPTRAALVVSHKCVLW